MRKTIALICSLILVVSMFVFPTAAADNPAAPEWLITEICANPEVYLADGTTNVGDIYEYIEIYNNSDKTRIVLPTTAPTPPVQALKTPLPKSHLLALIGSM